MGQKVTILAPSVPHYRCAFFFGLREYLLKRNVDLQLIHGVEENIQCATNGEFSPPWAKRVDHLSVKVGGLELCWQPYLRCIRDSDLVIVQQANRLLLNYMLIAKRAFSRQKLAFWGHGADLQRHPKDLRNRWKRVFANRVDWWFAYTEEVKAGLVKGSFPAERITNVQNSIDTEPLLRMKAEVSVSQLEGLRREMGLGRGPIGIYCGRIYSEKRIDFLFDACRMVRDREPSFELIVIGAGPEEKKVALASREMPWIHYVGARLNHERVPYFLLADMCLMPGLVGLVIIDCFALEVPLITTRFPFHSPEIGYLRNNENGVITVDTMESYVAGLCHVLSDRAFLAKLKAGCREARATYTMGAMVESFGKGVIACLGT